MPAFLTSEEMDTMSEVQLYNHLLSCNRGQREMCAKVNTRARKILNSKDELSVWISPANIQDILDEHCQYMQVGPKEEILRTLCRVCFDVYDVADLSKIDDEKERTKVLQKFVTHMATKHAEVWKMIGEDLFKNKLPYL